jgi:hypothetical protein
MTRTSLIAAGLLALAASTALAAEDRNAKVQTDRKEVTEDGHWIYNDLTKGFTEAARTRKAMLVVFRCIP